MTPSALRYQASREWMEAEILAGHPVQDRRQCLTFDLAGLESDLAERVESLLDGVLFLPVKGRVAVLDSGIDPEVSYGDPGGHFTPMDEPVVQKLGVLPELPEPTSDIAAVVAAWEDWVEKYRQESLKAIAELNAHPPSTGKSDRQPKKEASWGSVEAYFGPGSAVKVGPEDGAEAMQNALAGWAWTRAAFAAFSTESVKAAREATIPAPGESKAWIEVMEVEQVSAIFLHRVKKMYAAAKAHDKARRAKVSDFEVEMARWAAEHGSERLRLGIEDGYRMNARYLEERIAAEAPGFYAMPSQAAKDIWALRTSSPTEQALRLRRRVAAAMQESAPLNMDGPPKVEILTVFSPPHQMYYAESGYDLPSKAGWPWWYDEDGGLTGGSPKSFEAVVVEEWLGRFHLIGAVVDEHGSGPAGIWALPQLEHFHDDGTVEAQDPDEPPPNQAKRKPPGDDDDIPF
jgi:hypothetical protein